MTPLCTLGGLPPSLDIGDWWSAFSWYSTTIFAHTAIVTILPVWVQSNISPGRASCLYIAPNICHVQRFYYPVSWGNILQFFFFISFSGYGRYLLQGPYTYYSSPLSMSVYLYICLFMIYQPSSLFCLSVFYVSISVTHCQVTPLTVYLSVNLLYFHLCLSVTVRVPPLLIICLWSRLSVYLQYLWPEHKWCTPLD